MTEETESPFRLRRTFDQVDENKLDGGTLLQTISLVKQVWKTFMGTNVVYLTANDRVAAIRHYFKHSQRVKYPIAFISQNRIAYDEGLGVSAKNLVRTGTGHGITHDNCSATISKSFLLPSILGFDVTVYFDDEYEFIRWQERALINLATRSLGARNTYKGFEYDIHQAEPVYEISTPVKEPDQTPMPNAIEATISLTFRCKIGSVKDVAKFNNENHVTRNLNVQSPTGEVEQVAADFDYENDAHVPRSPSTQGMSRKDIQKRFLQR